MLKVFTAITKEVDDNRAAIKEILERLNLKENMKKNTVGIVHYFYEYEESGALQELVEALPFKIVGSVSTFLASNGDYGDTALTLTMLTSDDVDFEIFTISDLNNKNYEEITAEVKTLCGSMTEKEVPKVALTLLPPLKHYSADDLVETVNELPVTIPLYGTLSHHLGQNDFEGHLLVNGKARPDSLIFVAIYGDVTPKYHVTTAFAFDDSFIQDAVITDSDGPTLKTVNGITALEFLRQNQMLNSENNVVSSTIWVVPAILTLPNGLKIVRAFISMVDGTEYIFATGALPTGAKIKFAIMDGEKTLSSAEQLVKDLCSLKENDIIAYSCGARAWSLGVNHTGEAKIIDETSKKYCQCPGSSLNYTIAYAGGEICPILDNTGKLINALHNYTLIACSFN